MSSRYIIILAAAAIALVASPTVAQKSKLAKDVDFVRRLATKLRFIDLAQAEAATLQKNNKDKSDFKLVSQLDIEISLIGARAHPVREQRRTMFKEALDKSTEFIDRYSGEAVADDARVTMVQACVQYGEFMLEEIEVARDEAPDTVGELEQRAADIFERGIDECDKFIKANAGKISDDRELEGKYYYCWLNKGVLQREKARAVKRDRNVLCSYARETFEELILEIGEESLLGLRGYFEMSRINEVQGQYRAAVGEYTDTIDGIVTALSTDELDLSQGTRDRLFDLMQEAYGAATQALLKDGAVDDVLAMCKKFREHLKEFGVGEDPFEIATPNKGHPVFLTEAKAMAESGDPQQVAAALAQVKLINEKHPNDIIGIRAKTVLKDVMAVAGGDASIVTGSTLFEIAKGEYQSRNYETAIGGFKRAYSAMTDAERNELGLELWRFTGRCYGVQKRYAEASLAFARGLEAHGASGFGKVDATADSLEKAWNGYRNACRNEDDRALRAMGTRINSLLNRYGGEIGAGKRAWKEANKLLTRKKYTEAHASFAQIPTDSPYYEPAQARRVICLQQLDKGSDARKVIAEYATYIANPKHAVPADDKTGQAGRRGQTQAAMAHLATVLDYEAANPTKGTKDPTKFGAIIEDISNFLVAHKQLGQDYFPRAYDMRARLYCELGEIVKAEESYRLLKKEFPANIYIPGIATRIFSAHRDRVKALETEMDARIKAGNASDTRKTQEALTNARRDALAMGLDYSQASTRPKYAMLSNTLNLAKDVQDWATVEKLGLRIDELFGQDPRSGEKVRKFVKPAIGEALLRQKRFRDAEKMLKESIEANPKNYTLKRLLALTLGGWIDVDENLNEQIVAGLDRPDEAYSILRNDYRKYIKAKAKKYDLQWYRFQWECYWAALSAKDKDSKFKGYAKSIYNNTEAREEFATLKGLGPEGERIFQLFINHPPF